MNSKKNKHLTIDDRIYIQECLDKGMTFKAIAERLSKDPTTISKEVKKHIHTPTPNTNSSNNDICPLLLRAPYVCNPCNKRRHRCPYIKHLYLAKFAHQEYLCLLSESREGIPLSKKEFYETDAIISKGIENGQHLYHILQTNDLNVSKSTVYRHLHKGYYSVAAIDFPRVVKFKPRKNYAQRSVPKSIRIDRTYLDFRNYINDFDVSSWVEMDTVIGRIGGKTILTLNFTFCNFIIGLLLDNKSSLEVSNKIISLKKTLLSNGFCFGDIFPIILTDNGKEFSNISPIIYSLDNNIESNIFFCDPASPAQKPRIEKNHTLLRDILPKGSSFDNLNQDLLNIIFSHINSVKRKNLGGKSSFEVFAFTFGEKLCNCLGISYIEPKNVIQSPLLLKNLLK